VERENKNGYKTQRLSSCILPNRGVQETNRSERKERKKMNYPTVAIYHAQRHGREREEKKKRKGLIDIDHYLASLHFQI
jgi:hypothetical protein